jgi:hypothetical protein
MAALAPTGICSYNGFAWNATANTLDFSVKPVYDRAGRTVVYSVFSITLTEIISGRPTDAVVQGALSALTQPAAGLYYNNRGVGNVFINVGGDSDCVWGPKPRSATVKPLGGGNSCRLTWTIDFAIPTCGGARYTGPMEFNYSTDITIDQSGYTQRTYKGYIVIAQTRPNADIRVVTRSADDWRELVNPPLLTGFRRTPGQFGLSEDKCRLDFSIRDEQMGPNALPANVILADADHSFANSSPGQTHGWEGVITATYELALTGRPQDAIQAFVRLCLDRTAALRAGKEFKNKTLNFVLTKFTAADTKIYDKTTCRFALTYRVAGATLGEILQSGGLWRPVPGDNWKAWAASVKLPQSARGYAGIRFIPGEDSIIDLCGRVPAVAGAGAAAPLIDTSLDGIKPPADAVLKGGVKVAGVNAPLDNLFPAPPPERSWIVYDAKLRVETDSGMVHGSVPPSTPIPVSLATLRAAANAAGALDALDPDFAESPVGVGIAAAANAARVVAGAAVGALGGTFVQQRKLPVYYVFLSGYALRARYPVPVPTITDTGGAPLFPVSRPDAGEGFETRIAGNVEYPVYEARWNLRFVLPQLPSGPLDIPDNPQQT